MWLNIDNGSNYMYENLHVMCGRYQGSVSDYDGQQRPKLVQKFAINYLAWLDNKNHGPLKLLYALEKFGVLELLIVVGDTGHVGIGMETVFITPPKAPAETSLVASTPKNQKQPLLRGTWSDNEKIERQYLLGYKTEKLPALKQKLKEDKLEKEVLEKEKLREERSFLIALEKEKVRKEKVKGQSSTFHKILAKTYRSTENVSSSDEDDSDEDDSDENDSDEDDSDEDGSDGEDYDEDESEEASDEEECPIDKRLRQWELPQIRFVEAIIISCK